MLAALWLSNLHEALAYLASPQQRKPVTLGGRNWMEGRVSWYGGSRWRGKRTASGEVFDDRQLTAAAVDLPFGTLVRLSNKRNGRSVVVRVTDRFGGLKGRLLDISQAAAEVLGIKGQGVAKLTIEILGRTARVGGN
jgi:rare lipoprotein A